MTDAYSAKDELRKLAELIKDIRVAMMLTAREPAPAVFDPMSLHVRPMYTQKLDPETFAGELFFFTDATSVKVDELQANPNVLLTYAAPGSERFVVVTGRASCERDVAKARELWNLHAKGWWPAGPESADLVLIRVHVTSGEYWDGPSRLAYTMKLLSAVATNTRMPTSGEHGKV